MTQLRQRMLEDMQIRNFSENTQQSYLMQVSLFARHFRRSPEGLGPHPDLPSVHDEREEARTWLDQHRHGGVAFPVHRDAEEALGRCGSLADAEGVPDVAGHLEPG